MNSGTAPTRAPRMQAAPEYENLPAVVAQPPATPNLLAPQPTGMAQGFAQPEGGGGGYGAPAQSNTTFGQFMSALGFSGFDGPQMSTAGQMPGDVTGTGFAQQQADIAAQMGATSGSAPLGAVSSEQLGDLGAQDGGGPETNAVGGDIGGGPQGDFGGQMAGLAGMYRGGIVTANRLQGPDPRGPDDGYVAMDKGEGVLTAKAVQHYGPGIVARLNKLAVPKAAFAKR